MAKAPEAVVAKECKKLADMENTWAELNRQLAKIKAPGLNLRY